MSELRQLSAALQQAAEQQLNEDPSRTPEHLDQLRGWLREQPHLHLARTDDQFLIAFLRGCKFNMKKSQQKLDTYYSIRNTAPEFFKRRDPMSHEIQEVLRLGVMLPYPGVDTEGRRVFIIRMGIFDPSKVNILNIYRVTLMLVDIMMLEDDAAMVHGTVCLLDMAGISWAHVLQMQPSLIKKIIACLQDGYPVRPKGINYYHLPRIFEAVFNFFKTFMKEKLRNRIYLHGSNLESVYKNIPRSALPKEYGGNGVSLAEVTATWKEKIESYRDYFVEDEQRVTDESKRPRKAKSRVLFGWIGSFS